MQRDYIQKDVTDYNSDPLDKTHLDVVNWAYLAKMFQPVHQQEEHVGAMLRSSTHTHTHTHTHDSEITFFYGTLR